MYVHEPSLMTIVCRGKTIQGTWPQFTQRLEALLNNYHFSDSFSAFELKRADGYVVSKTRSKSIFGNMNQMVTQLEYDCSKFDSYAAISLDVLESRMMEYLFLYGGRSKGYQTPSDYWKAKNFLIGKGH